MKVTRMKFIPIHVIRTNLWLNLSSKNPRFCIGLVPQFIAF
jgi:hypothetical protein